ncbi:sulfatase-like hydrolase/transferase [Ramlibacter alkalitolerans]|uniref:Sulfatase-like hydrolase/transferase n=1 Tax=Ramlibacter alkalitolerans TaxID=2039631 RepID=A0ABS1JPQ6_9BURK|nr:sulfatase-like hydrolase/transferase [Ramlibacter alkalitolerans]MBL0425520.1 sulfatase-like hydrolase/transferase [Ramlibacter alkalitolerans]
MLTAALLEALAWLAPAAAFLWIYTSRLGATSAAVLPHLGVVGALAAVTVLIRWLLACVSGRKASAAGGALLTATVLLALCLYYILAVVGFGAWGYLVSWGLLSTYVHQISYMPDVFGPIVYVAGGLLLVLFLALVACIHAFYKRRDWVPAAIARAPRVMDAAGCATVLVLAIFAWRYTEAPPTTDGEPLALSFWPDPFSRKFQHNHLPQSAQLARDELAARAAYANVQRRPGSNVILIVSDALRSRNMGVYGYARPTTPFLSGAVATGSATRLRRVQSVCAESACGLLGIASSRYVHQFVDKPLALAEVLRLHGYEAHMVLSGDHTNFYGLRAMYGQVDSYFDGSMARWAYANDDANVLGALKQLKTRSAQGNFLQVHLMAAHVVGRRSPPERFGEEENYFPPPPKSPSEEQRQRFVNFYDSGVQKADETIGQLLDVLRSKGLLDDAIVIVTADHGEYIGERGLYAHAKGVFSEVVDIPLVLMTFGKAAPLRINEGRLASQVDIAPTVLSQLGIPVPATWSGVPLQSAAAPGGRQVHFQQGAEFGVVERKQDGRTWKYWIDARTGQEFAFDLDTDPLESSNRAAQLDPSDRKRWRTVLTPLEVNAREFVSSH